MSSLLQLLIRHGLAAFAGTLAAQGLTVDASSTSSLVTALIIFAGASLWSWVVKLKWSTDNRTMHVIDDTTAEMIRKLLGAFVSQGMAAFSGYLATQGHSVNVDDPVALSVFGANLALSKAGVQQKLANIGAGDALKLCLLSASVLSLASCLQFKGFMERNQATLEGILIDEVRRVVPSAKQPQNVQPVRSADDADSETILEDPEPTAPVCEEPRGETLPACLKLTPRIIVPRYGVQVAEALQLPH